MKQLKLGFAVILAVLLTTSLSGCSNPEGLNRYRYPCQDPVNWEKAECNPPVCEASGLCTKDLLGKTTVESGTSNE
jgi:hypothetical protein